MHHAGTLTPRERRHEQTLALITDAAMRLVEEGGLEALSINKLAAVVDYTPGALYRYFDSKDALLSALVLRVLGDIGRHIERAVDALGTRLSPLARVVAIVHGYRTFARAEPHRFGLFGMTMADPRILLVEHKTAAPVAAASVAALQPLANAFAEAAAAGQLAAGDAVERTLLVFGLLQGVLQLHKQVRFAPQLDPQHLALRGTRALLLGWGAEPRTVDDAIERVIKGERT